MRIQRELVDKHKDISATTAGEELYREINAQVKKHQEVPCVVREMRVFKEETCLLKEEVRVLKEEMRAMRVENEETKRELQKMQQETKTR